LSGSVDDQEVLRRFRVFDGSPIGEALMNQTIVSGIGNVYKSEILFLNRVSPFATVATLTDERILALIARASELMARNVSGYRRQTRFGRDGGRLWVYGRHGKPCYECGEHIRIRRQGDLGRTTYWCPVCQE
jgi:endonuclease-8